jgi:hypothetical protein
MEINSEAIGSPTQAKVVWAHSMCLSLNCIPTWQTDALGAVCTAPADLAGAAVGLGAVALAVDAARLADGIAAVVRLVAVAGHATNVPALVADVVIVILKLNDLVNETVAYGYVL